MPTDAFEVIGGRRLQGEITPQGAKNEALQILCAILLSPEPITVSNIPIIQDVKRLLALLEGLGVKMEQVNENTYTFLSDDINLNYLHSPEFKRDAQRIRGSVMLVGALLGRFGQALLPKPGGDKIGRRRLDTHFLGFIKLGAKFEYDAQNYMYSVKAEKLKGTYILMEEISVTGTANVVMAAVLAEGTTQIYNAACEPYVQQLCRMLNRMGAKISGVGSNLLTIEGVDSLGGTEHRILPDMIEIGSFIGMAAMTQSELTIKDAQVHELGKIIPVFRKLGIQIDIKGMIFLFPIKVFIKFKDL